MGSMAVQFSRLTQHEVEIFCRDHGIDSSFDPTSPDDDVPISAMPPEPTAFVDGEGIGGPIFLPKAPHVITPGGMGIIRRTEAIKYRACDSYVSVFSGSKSRVGSSGSKAVTSVRRAARKVGHGTFSEEEGVREGASFSGSFVGGSGPGVNQANPIQVDDLDDINLLADLMGLTSLVKKESSNNRVVEMDPLERCQGRLLVGSPVGVMKAKVVSRGKGKDPEVVQKVYEEGKDEDDDVAHNSALEDEKLMLNVIVHVARLASSLPDVINRWKVMQEEYSEAVTVEVIADTKIKSLTSERDDLREKQRDLVKRINSLESRCKAADKELGKVAKEMDDLAAMVGKLRAEKVTDEEKLKKVEKLDGDNKWLTEEGFRKVPSQSAKKVKILTKPDAPA
ncbi:hypothetical protein QVD17_37957 [Tagetes erecta]|uniref:Uncharacterized protein n=1 Tax=Tagetes erecta TaxID=13708 RepID=A0AAD8NKH8_TARER|nr:hypothetical protein QVD17_37957 [Tagetes erecta]